MTRKSKPPSLRRKKIVLPTLSDEALVQIQDFLHLALDVFEALMATQIPPLVATPNSSTRRAA